MDEGVCPKCGGQNLDYDALEISDNQVYYPFTCDDCGCEGKEWYELSFSEITIDGDE